MARERDRVPGARVRSIERRCTIHPWHHAVSSAKKYGGEPEDYLAIHQFFDQSKQLIPDVRHRAILHHTWGIFLAERILGATITNTAGRIVPMRFIGEQHVKEDLLRIPTVQDWLECLVPKPWMLSRSRLLDEEPALVECCQEVLPK